MENKFDKIILLDDDARGKVHRFISRNGLSVYECLLTDPHSISTSIIAFVGKSFMECADIILGTSEKIECSLPMPTKDSFPEAIAIELLRKVNANGKSVLLLCDQVWSIKDNGETHNVYNILSKIVEAFSSAKSEVEYTKMVVAFYSSSNEPISYMPESTKCVDIVKEDLIGWSWENIDSSLWNLNQALSEGDNNA